MKSDHIENIEVDGQVLYCPKPEQWDDIYRLQSFEGIKISPRILELLKRKVECNSRYPDLTSCIAIYYNRVMFYELLQLDDQKYRVHVEAVICENCGHRAEISATPDRRSYHLAGPAYVYHHHYAQGSFLRNFFLPAGPDIPEELLGQALKTRHEKGQRSAAWL
jgi:hypothetical protein